MAKPFQVRFGITIYAVSKKFAGADALIESIEKDETVPSETILPQRGLIWRVLIFTLPFCEEHICYYCD